MLVNFVADQFSHDDLNHIELNIGYRFYDWFDLEEYTETKIDIRSNMVRFQSNEYSFAGKARARSGANAKTRLMLPSLPQ